MAIISYIGAHWVEWLFTLCLAALTWAWRTVSARLKAETKKNEAIADGVQSLLRESIVGNYNRYADKGFCPIYAKESIKKVYHAYSNLGGNDVATDLYKKMLEMPTEKREGE
ncbi:MAG: hypothetical protein IJW90_01905 [Clostridia bacterium]|nr:hypothetical protein [Clostridia bacterium]